MTSRRMVLDFIGRGNYAGTFEMAPGACSARNFMAGRRQWGELIGTGQNRSRFFRFNKNRFVVFKNDPDLVNVLESALE